MPTLRETILTALFARLSALSATTLRGDVLPERVPAAGLLILRDGDAVVIADSGLVPGQIPLAEALAALKPVLEDESIEVAAVVLSNQVTRPAHIRANSMVQGNTTCCCTTPSMLTPPTIRPEVISAMRRLTCLT